jgi:hypothetical protein
MTLSNKLDDKLAHKVASQTNVTHFCLVCQSEVCCKPNWFATNSLRQLCERACRKVCCKNVVVETHLNTLSLLQKRHMSNMLDMKNSFEKDIPMSDKPFDLRGIHARKDTPLLFNIGHEKRHQKRNSKRSHNLPRMTKKQRFFAIKHLSAFVTLK